MTTQILLEGRAVLNLMANCNNSEQFQRLVHKDTIIDAKLNFLTCEGETISVDVFEFLQLNWQVVE